MANLLPNKNYKTKTPELKAKIDKLDFSKGRWPAKGQILTKDDTFVCTASWSLSGFFVDEQNPTNFDLKIIE